MPLKLYTEILTKELLTDLCTLQNKSIKEISELLSIPVATISQYLRKFKIRAKSRKFGIEFVKNECLQKGFIFQDLVYISSARPQPIKCVTCGTIMQKRFIELLKNKPICPGCMSISHELQRQSLKKIGFELLEVTTKSSITKQKVKHITCGYIWDVRPRQLLVAKGGCPSCSKKVKHSIPELIQKYDELGFVFLSENYKNAFAIYDTKCKKCNHIWGASVNTILNVGNGCPACCGLKNEKTTIQVLKELFGEKHVFPQFSISCPDTIRFSKKTKIDAKIEINNKIYYVEYNGRQHYQAENFYQPKETKYDVYAHQLKRDNWLREHCKENNIYLIEIDGRFYTNFKIKPYLIEQFTALGLLGNLSVMN